MMRIKFLSRAMISRFGKLEIDLEDKQAMQYINAGHAIAIGGSLSNPPMNKIIGSPVAKKDSSESEEEEDEEEPSKIRIKPMNKKREKKRIPPIRILKE